MKKIKKIEHGQSWPDVAAGSTCTCIAPVPHARPPSAHTSDLGAERSPRLIFKCQWLQNDQVYLPIPH